MTDKEESGASTPIEKPQVIAEQKEKPKEEKAKEPEQKVAEPEQPKKAKEQPKEKPKKQSLHTIPLRRAFEKPSGKMRKAAITEIKRYIRKHTRKEPKVSEEVNSLVWEKSKPPRRIKVRIVEEGEFAVAELP
ncbi:MAG: hypothetical protein J7L23_03090 [Candidatus Diapherotrites archaeon]|nr:hypothetical protein [Candidatus Diapherotrites archaeon]